MNNKQFYIRLSKELYENTHPKHREHVKDLKITSLEQVLGIFRSVMIRNKAHLEEAEILKKELKSLANVIGLKESDFE